MSSNNAIGNEAEEVKLVDEAYFARRFRILPSIHVLQGGNKDILEIAYTSFPILHIRKRDVEFWSSK
ncbi:hypothetical protein CEXT_92501 [Caerostris extrusa]|uniref:Uncharacterized protein n=1 Tax=Caerostris extrusa TaxID=172846 RepID=A0AAV4REB2_CAEEX|nr:hypothetical protein CEXT_92501 [Caerostris extrusa]